MSEWTYTTNETELYHYGIKGMKWGIRRYVNKDGTLTPAGKARYYNPDGTETKAGKKFNDNVRKTYAMMEAGRKTDLKLAREEMKYYNTKEALNLYFDGDKSVQKRNRDIVNTKIKSLMKKTTIEDAREEYIRDRRSQIEFAIEAVLAGAVGTTIAALYVYNPKK